MAGEQPQLIAELSSGLTTAFVLAAPGLRIAGTRVQPAGWRRGGQPCGRHWLARRSPTPRARCERCSRKTKGVSPASWGAVGVDRAAAGDRASSRGAGAGSHRHRPPRSGRVRSAAGAQESGAPPLQPAIARSSPARRLSANKRRRPDSAPWHAPPVDRGIRGGQRRSGDSSRGEKTGAAAEDMLDFGWLCEAIFVGDAAEHRRRYMMVLFASATPAVCRVSPSAATRPTPSARQPCIPR